MTLSRDKTQQRDEWLMTFGDARVELDIQKVLAYPRGWGLRRVKGDDTPFTGLVYKVDRSDLINDGNNLSLSYSVDSAFFRSQSRTVHLHDVIAFTEVFQRNAVRHLSRSRLCLLECEERFIEISEEVENLNSDIAFPVITGWELYLSDISSEVPVTLGLPSKFGIYIDEFGYIQSTNADSALSNLSDGRLKYTLRIDFNHDAIRQRRATFNGSYSIGILGFGTD